MTIKQKREELKMTQVELSKKTEIQVRTLQRIEKDNYCNLRNAIKIAKALNTPVEKLFEELKE